ncbi:MAG: hypothetical protein AB1631_09580 [Acidobacteriota bacterium]
MALLAELILAGFALIGLVLAVATRFASARWNGKISQLVDELFRALPGEKHQTVSFKECEQQRVVEGARKETV